MAPSKAPSGTRTLAGARLRRLREERGLTQVALARELNLSTSYVNQLENDQRPITVPVLLALTDRFNLPAQYFSPDSDARLVADLREMFTATAGEHAASDAQIEELVARMPEIGNSLVTMHRRLRGATEELESYRSLVYGDSAQAMTRPMPFEEVRDFFYDRNNYIDELDGAAEKLFADTGMRFGGLDIQLSALLAERFGVTVAVVDDLPAGTKRVFDPATRVLRIAHWLLAGQRAFQIATQLALLTQQELLSDLVAGDQM